MVAVIGCEGGTQELALSVTCAATGAEATSAASPIHLMSFMISSSEKSARRPRAGAAEV
jgi:hypothetical protein